MSVRASSMVWEHSRQKGSARLVLLAIADYAKDDCTGAYPSMERMAQKTLISKRNIVRLVAHLERSGELRVRHGAGPRGCNMYDITLQENGVAGGSEPALPLGADGDISATVTSCHHRNVAMVTNRVAMVTKPTPPW